MNFCHSEKMSFSAKLINATIYPRNEKVLMFSTLKQGENFIKVSSECNLDDLSAMLAHTGLLRVFTLEEPSSTTYKGKEVSMYKSTKIVPVMEHEMKNTVIMDSWNI